MLEATILEERRWTSAPRRAIAMPDTRGGARWVVALIVLLIVGLALRLYEFRGFGALDDAAYAQIAHQMASGMFRIGAYNGPAVFPLRVGIIYPTALLFRHAGVSEWTMVLFPFAISILSIVLIYVATNHFFGQRAAVIGAALWAILPLDAFQASVLAPDLPAAFFSSLGIFGIIWTIDSRIRRTGALLFCGLAAGAALGVSWLCKESVAYAAPFCAGLVVAALRKDRRRCVVLWAGVALGAVTVLAGEMTVYHRATGDWLFHFHETERNHHQYKNAFFVAGSSLTSPHEHSYARAVLRRLFLDGPETILLHTQLMYLPLFAAIVCLHAWYSRRKSYLIPGLWFVTLGLMFNFASSSFTSYVPLVLFERYLFPILVPAVILVSGFLATLFFDEQSQNDRLPRREGRFWGALLVGCLVLVAAAKNHANRNFAPGWASEVRTLSRSLRPSDRVYTDILSIHGLEFFWSYPRTMRTVRFEDTAGASSLVAGDYVLLNTAYLNWLVSKAGWWPTRTEPYEPPAFYGRIPSSWETTWTSGNATLYRIK